VGIRYESAWEKLDKYHKLTDESRVYRVAAVLDPRMKLTYFRSQAKWPSERMVEVRRAVRSMYDEYKIGEEEEEDVPDITQPKTAVKKPTFDIYRWSHTQIRGLITNSNLGSFLSGLAYESLV
jgi:Domain of unknown function (DUF4413)